jgi:ubiquinone biosynthesis protein
LKNWRGTRGRAPFFIDNRITVGLIIAALIVGAALLMLVDMDFRIWGYPGLAIIFFLCAAGAGIAVLLNILFYDKSKGD